MANSKIVASKAEAVEKLAKQMSESKSYFLCEYAGLTVEQMEQLRAELRKEQCVLKVATNNIIKRAAAMNGFSQLSDIEGPSCLIISNKESVDGPKAASAFCKTNKKLIMKDGVVDGQYCTKEEIVAVSALPSRMAMLTMLAGGMLQPVQQLALGLNMIANPEEK